MWRRPLLPRRALQAMGHGCMAHPGARESPGTSPVRFADVDPEQWWASHVERIAESGITAGCATGPARYCPDDPVTWGQMATFVARVLDLEPRPDPIENGGVTRPEVDFEAVAVGRSHSCGLRADGTVACWGVNASGQADPPDGLFTVITAGYEHSCGLHRYGTVACWGGNRYGQLNLPDGRFMALATGDHHTCAVGVDGTITCRGRNHQGQLNPPEGSFTAVAAGADLSCGLHRDRMAVCWGPTPDGRPDRREGPFSVLAVGGGYACGLGSDSEIECWAYGGSGEPQVPDGRFTSVTIAGSQVCGLHPNGTATCGVTPSTALPIRRSVVSRLWPLPVTRSAGCGWTVRSSAGRESSLCRRVRSRAWRPATGIPSVCDRTGPSTVGAAGSCRISPGQRFDTTRWRPEWTSPAG